MFRFAILMLLCCAISISAGLIKKRSASHSGEYGGNGGKRFSHAANQLDGPITVLKIRTNRLYITGLQVRYGKVWSDYVGGQSGDLHTIALEPGESIVQVSGRSVKYLRKLEFLTNLGRRFSFGADAGTSFTALPVFPRAVLSYLSGRSGNVIDAISFHWNVKCTLESGH
ncbi:PREDICTED: zymogen granule membrane protein 16-like [Gekko japonicus]|uniref:Zymogen granule membrane protein 16-like n=1 Tax=Gekko japonicus TaxID=146911 RepID=A0ABM1KNG4_GEKJA|nr:PREDICTED: zymogen granule membrane protein 16-like [Gekko japonicus]